MKKSLIIVVFMIFSGAVFAQEQETKTQSIELTETVAADKPETNKSLLSAKIKAKVLKINRKKSKEIISIKAYRKSLQIKVKTVKLC